MGKLILNTPDQNVYNKLQLFADKADSIYIAVAFLTESKLILDWNGKGKKIELIISLRPPTSYYSLKEIQSSVQTQIYFLGSDFHSKIWIFYKQKRPFAALLGSSNFSNGGLINNTEANLAIEDDQTLSELHNHFIKDLFPSSNRLQPSDLNAYKAVYDNYLQRRTDAKSEIKIFINKIKSNQRNKISKPCKEAREYFEFWRIVDEIKEIIAPIADKNFPGEPYYLVLDHFWHWVKAVWYKESQTILKSGKQILIIPKLFQQYIKWQKLPENANYPKWMLNQSKIVFKRYLSEKNIDKLSQSSSIGNLPKPAFKFDAYSKICF
jgi:HKD family nuclease